ncbi:SDR family NAD(P)-dependent oxidoreductase [Parasporobacterium paucivorans]|uniref:NAD(P)-dependent dehydrogenase, short-chain alcohol dehydrogenase family n=1 Tax=Parasporobacterium paucivorans DSM 15970 TaxID=1122934 RepID=A0A1M6K4F9_9FIRM|nr:SDR family oxidoreductase [Parasporobacterium paucivorans]SHJ53874.1 NAD(P)-dependent dehydrogenase, short-chain alcohol dehydrogenase family [Parasporobacterium paucivorans DSM 15970]
MGKLDGKVAVISGAGYGLGRGIALAMGKEGAKVATIGRTREKLEDFQKEMDARGYDAMYFVGDVTKRESVNEFIDAVAAKWGTVDIDINNAMAYNMRSFIETTDEDIDKIFDSAVRGSVYMMQACYPYFKKNGSGKVVNFSSIAGQYGMVDHSSYAIAKAGLSGLTRAVALEWAKDNIQVNAIAPAGATPAWFKFEKEQPKEVVQAFLSQIPAGHMGDPETDIGPAVVFLSSADSNWITSRTIFVDGGQGAIR